MEEFDISYNAQRPHKGLPGRITPQQAWHVIAVAAPPRPPREPVSIVVPTPTENSFSLGAMAIPALIRAYARTGAKTNAEEGHQHRVVAKSGTVGMNGIVFQLSFPKAGHVILAVWDQAR